MGAPENRIIDRFDLNELPPVEDDHPMEAELFGAARKREAASTLASWALRHQAMKTGEATAPARSAHVVRPNPLRSRAPFDSRGSSSAMKTESVGATGSNSWPSSASKIPINVSKPLYSYIGSAFAGMAPLPTANGDTRCVHCSNNHMSLTPCIQNAGQNDLPYPVTGSEHRVGTSHQVPCHQLQSGTASSHSSHVEQIVQASVEVNQQRMARKELEFINAFPFNTERCNPWDPCTRCLALFEAPIPRKLAFDSKLGMQFPDATYFSRVGEDGEHRPPVLRILSQAAAAKRNRSRTHGPRGRTSAYRGVSWYGRTGRWEAMIWQSLHGQISLGASVIQEEAAACHFKAAIMLRGPAAYTNFNVKNYQVEITHLYKLNLEQLVIYLRRDSRGYGAEATYYGVSTEGMGVHKAKLDGRFLGIYTTEEDAARAVFKEALRCCDFRLACWLMSTHHVRNMPSYAMSRLDALNPDAAAVMQSIVSTARKNSSGKRMKSPVPKRRAPGCGSATKTRRIRTLGYDQF